MRNGASDPHRYRIVVRGEVGGSFEALFEGMTLERSHGHTDIVGQVADQSALQGLLAQIGSLGLEIVSVNPQWDTEDE